MNVLFRGDNFFSVMKKATKDDKFRHHCLSNGQANEPSLKLLRKEFADRVKCFTCSSKSIYYSFTL